MLVCRFGKFILPTNFVNSSRLVGSESRTKASLQPLCVMLKNIAADNQLNRKRQKNISDNADY